MDHSFEIVRGSFEAFEAKLRSQPATDWQGPFGLPPNVADLYHQLGPDDTAVPAYGNDIFIPSLANLWAFQVGYRSHALTGAELADWPDRLLVIANRGGDPIALDRTDGTIAFAFSGSGAWTFEQITDSLSDLVCALGVLGKIAHQAVPDLCDDDSIVKSEYAHAAVSEMTELIGAKVAHQMVRWAGWQT